MSAPPLVSGTNILAVELHQYDLSSSDASFDFALVGNPPDPAPRMTLVRFGPQMAVNWSGSGFWLEQATQVTGPWTPMTDTAPATVNISAAQQFFRLRKP